MCVWCRSSLKLPQHDSQSSSCISQRTRHSFPPWACEQVLHDWALPRQDAAPSQRHSAKHGKSESNLHAPLQHLSSLRMLYSQVFCSVIHKALRIAMRQCSVPANAAAHDARPASNRASTRRFQHSVLFHVRRAIRETRRRCTSISTKTSRST